jgi:hypothetical protein
MGLGTWAPGISNSFECGQVFYLISLSALSRTVSGTLKCKALAVFRLNEFVLRRPLYREVPCGRSGVEPALMQSISIVATKIIAP